MELQFRTLQNHAPANKGILPRVLQLPEAALRRVVRAYGQPGPQPFNILPHF